MSRRKTTRSVVLGAALLFFVVPSAFISCVIPFFDDDRITILFYNVQNVFDAVDDGSEYEEFTSQAGWNADGYNERLRTLARVVLSVEPKADVVAFAEIENESVLADLQRDYLVDRPFPYRAATHIAGSATQVGVVSRIPVRAIRSHRVEHHALSYPLRAILEVELEIEEEPLVLFVNHWKSRRGGIAATEPMRIASATALHRRVDELVGDTATVPIVITGDFNEPPTAYEEGNGEYTTAIMPGDLYLPGLEVVTVSTERDAVVDAASTLVYTPWSDCVSCAVPGSYYYDGEWEAIDAFYLNGALLDGTGLDLEAFYVLATDETLTATGTPRTWYDGSGGVSDHLPIVLILATDSRVGAEPSILSPRRPNRDSPRETPGWDGGSEPVRVTTFLRRRF